MSDSEKETENDVFLCSQIQLINTIHQGNIETSTEIERKLDAELSVYQGVIPNSEISDPNEKEAQLLHLYQQYLMSLMIMVDKSNSISIRKLGAKFLSGLARIAFAFNFNQTLVSVVVGLANEEDTDISEPCVAALKDLVLNEFSSNISLMVLDEVTRVLDEGKNNPSIRVPAKINWRLLGILLLIRPLHVDMYLSEDDTRDPLQGNRNSFDFHKELKRKRARIDQKLQNIHCHEIRGEKASIQSGLYQKLIYVLLEVFKLCTTHDHDQSANKSYLPKRGINETTLLMSLRGILKFGEYLNLELVELLIKSLWDYYIQIDTEVLTGSLTVAGGSQARFFILAALYRFSSEYRRIKSINRPIVVQNNLKVPCGVKQIQEETMRQLDSIVYPPLSNIQNGFSSDSDLLSSKNKVKQMSSRKRRNCDAYGTRSSRVEWKKLVDGVIKTVFIVFEIDKWHRKNLNVHRRRSRGQLGQGLTSLLHKLIQHTLCTPDFISERLHPLINLLIELLAYGKNNSISDDHEDSKWQTFAYIRRDHENRKADPKLLAEVGL